MKPKTAIVGLVSIICGLAAAGMSSKVLKESKETIEVKEEKVAVLVAKSQIPIGTTTKNPERLFGVKLYLKGEQPKKAIQVSIEGDQTSDDVAQKLYDQVKGKVTNKAMAQEAWISADDLADGNAVGLAAQIPVGYRAYGVKVDVSAVAGGFVLPNSRVDVLWVQRKGDTDSVAKTLLENVLVLAVGQNDQRPEDKRTLMEPTVTLALKPDDVNKMTLASELGSLKLSLRGFNDETKGNVRDADMRALSSKAGDATDGNPNEVVDGNAKTDGATAAPPWTNIVPVPSKPPVATPPGPAAPATVAIETKDSPKVHMMLIHNGASVKKISFKSPEEGGETLREDVYKAPVLEKAPTLTPAPAVPAPASTSVQPM